MHVLRGQRQAAAGAAKSLQSCLTLCDPIDSSPPGSSVPGILQARILEWVAISFSNICIHAKSFQSCPTLCNPMDSSPQAPLSTGFSRQEYWSGLPFPSPKEGSKQTQLSRFRKNHKNLKPFGSTSLCVCCVFCLIFLLLWHGNTSVFS